MADISIQMFKAPSGAWVVAPVLAGTGKHGKFKRFSTHAEAVVYARNLRRTYQAKGHKSLIQRIGE